MLVLEDFAVAGTPWPHSEQKLTEPVI